MSNLPLSPDGAWYWDGRRWFPTQATPGPLPGFLGRRRGSHWDGGELFVRCGRGAFVASAAIWLMLIPTQVFLFAVTIGALTGQPSIITPSVLAGLAVWVGAVACLIGCEAYFLTYAIRPPSIRLSARGILARQPWRGALYVPWDEVVEIGAHRAIRTQLTVEVSEDFWRYLGRRWIPRWAAPFALGGPPRAASLITLPPKGTGMEMADILRCARQVAPARVLVTVAPPNGQA